MERTQRRTELTPEVEEALADEAEAGYDLDAPGVVRRGRPAPEGLNEG